MRFPTFERGSLSLLVLGCVAMLVLIASDVLGSRDGASAPIILFGLFGTAMNYRVWLKRRRASAR